MKSAIYIGSNPILKGQMALIRKSPMNGRILVQFDNKELKAKIENTDEFIRYGFGWHEFDAKDFKDAIHQNDE